MKFFSEFASCWGGAAITPTAEPAGARRKSEECNNTRGRRASRTTAKMRDAAAAAHWKPKLNAISENSPISDSVGAVHEKRQPRKVRSKLRVKAAAPQPLAEDHWKYSQAMAPSSFAPTSYLF